MRAVGMLILLLTPPLTQASLRQSYQKGKTLADSKGKEVKEALSTDLSKVPGFQTDRPPESNLNLQTLSEETLKQSQTHEASSYMAYHAKNRKTYQINSQKDPLMVEANKALKDPFQTLKEKVVEDKESKPPEKEELVTCTEGGGEYFQTCSKYRVIELRVKPAVFKTEWSCPGHTVSKSGFLWSSTSTEFHNPGCVSKQVVKRKKKVEILKDEWQDGCLALEEKADQGLCRYVSVQKGPKETRMIQKQKVTRDPWVQTYQYACFKPVQNTCEPLAARGCVQVSSKCQETIGGVCVSWLQTYRCEPETLKLKGYKASSSSFFCLTGECVDTSFKKNTEMLNVMTHLAVLSQVQKDLRADLGIFKGQVRKCSKSCASFKDCCGNLDGWGVNLSLSSCSGEEKELLDWRQKNKCVYVGTYCSQKVAGVCLTKKAGYCCFGSRLSRLIQEQGRSQLGIGFGSGEHPDCRGLTPQELSSMDFSKMDLSELYSDIKANFKPKNLKEASLDRLKTNMKNLSPKVSS